MTPPLAEPDALTSGCATWPSCCFSAPQGVDSRRSIRIGRGRLLRWPLSPREATSSYAAERSVRIAAEYPDGGRSPWVTPQRVIGRDLDDHDTYAVRILDPHLDQPPRLRPGFTRDLHSRR